MKLLKNVRNNNFKIFFNYKMEQKIYFLKLKLLKLILIFGNKVKVVFLIAKLQ
jgi:hypothetical protein